MTNKPLAGIALAVWALAVLTIAGARAADPPFCRQYSEAALKQVRDGLADRHCAAGMQGSRWSTDFAVHYEWCLGVSNADAGAEREARTRYLRRCQ